MRRSPSAAARRAPAAAGGEPVGAGAREPVAVVVGDQLKVERSEASTSWIDRSTQVSRSGSITARAADDSWRREPPPHLRAARGRRRPGGRAPRADRPGELAERRVQRRVGVGRRPRPRGRRRRSSRGRTARSDPVIHRQGGEDLLGQAGQHERRVPGTASRASGRAVGPRDQPLEHGVGQHRRRAAIAGGPRPARPPRVRSASADRRRRRRRRPRRRRAGAGRRAATASRRRRAGRGRGRARRGSGDGRRSAGSPRPNAPPGRPRECERGPRPGCTAT